MEIDMSKLSYKKLFKMLIDIDMKNIELMEKAKISKSTFYKMKNGSILLPMYCFGFVMC